MSSASTFCQKKIGTSLRELDERKLQELSHYAVSVLHLAPRFLTDADLLRLAIRGVQLTPEIENIFRQIQAEDGRRKPEQTQTMTINGQELFLKWIEEGIDAGFSLNEDGLVFCDNSEPALEILRDRLHNQDAIEGSITLKTIFFFDRPNFPKDRIRKLWNSISALPEFEFLRTRSVRIAKYVDLR